MREGRNGIPVLPVSKLFLSSVSLKEKRNASHINRICMLHREPLSLYVESLILGYCVDILLCSNKEKFCGAYLDSLKSRCLLVLPGQSLLWNISQLVENWYEIQFERKISWGALRSPTIKLWNDRLIEWKKKYYIHFTKIKRRNEKR